MDGSLVGLVREGTADLPLHRGLDESVVGVVRRVADELHSGGPRDSEAADGDMGGLRVQLHRYLQNTLPLSTVDG